MRLSVHLADQPRSPEQLVRLCLSHLDGWQLGPDQVDLVDYTIPRSNLDVMCGVCGFLQAHLGAAGAKFSWRTT